MHGEMSLSSVISRQSAGKSISHHCNKTRRKKLADGRRVRRTPAEQKADGKKQGTGCPEIAILRY